MFGVGALDAFFCDAYADLLAKTLQAKEREPAVDLPRRVLNVKIPVAATIRDGASQGWKWRMAARGLIEDETVLSLKEVRGLFNQFCGEGHKLSESDTIADWMQHSDSKARIFGVTPDAFRRLGGDARNSAIEAGRKRLEARFEMIIQRRHDCIHNCDRPRIAIDRTQIDNFDYLRKVLSDIEFLSARVTQTLRSEFDGYLSRIGFSGATRRHVGA